MASSNDKQTADFDPYHHWLGIPKEKQPPSYYQLLGITDGESDEEVIRAAGVRQSAYVRNFQTGPHGEEAVQILNEIGEAIGTLADGSKRKKYEAEFGRHKSESNQLEELSLHEFEEFNDDYQYSETQQETDLPYQSNGFADTYPSLPRQATNRRPQRKRRRTTKPFIEQYWIWGPAMLIVAICVVLISKQFGGNSKEQIAESSGNSLDPGKSDPLGNPRAKTDSEKKTDPAENKPVIDSPPLRNPKPNTFPKEKPDPAENKPVIDSPPSGNPKPKIVPEKKTVPAENKPVIDLLKQIDVRTSLGEGRWFLSRGFLVSTQSRNPKVIVAASVPAEYDLRMRVKRLSGTRSLIVIAPVDGHQVPSYFDFYNYIIGDPVPYTGVGTYNMAGPDEQPNPHKGLVLRRNKSVDIEIAVRKGSLTIKVDSKVIFKWTGDSSRFQLNEAWQIPNKRALYLGASSSGFRITRAELVDQTQSDGKKPATPAVNYALHFDGRDDYVEFPVEEDWSTGPITFEAFATLDDASRNLPALMQAAGFKLRNFAESRQWMFLVYRQPEGSLLIATPERWKTGVRTHIAGVYDGGKVRLFVNGQLRASDTVPAGFRVLSGLKTGLLGGSTAADGRGFFHGVIDEFRVSKTARYTSSFTPQTHFNTDKDTLILYHCDDRQGTKLIDSSGHNRHGTIHGATYVNPNGTAIKAQSDGK